ncbi:PREDICTED: uncharacterized protein LOC109173367 [Ipomoea nil]|uniref:uncharacterized protein LOC109173367 n=1 Tax=Ipomoea nil TaxID=35883 RepID=UPI0009015593|nr:PREDICTED: uncharacterized protein LOC109173367 [Ipomoea nil]
MTNPFTIFITKSKRLELWRKIIDADSPLSVGDTDRALVTAMHHPDLMDGLTIKETRQLQALARHLTDDPWCVPPPDRTASPSAMTTLPPAHSVNPSPPLEDNISLSTSRKLDLDSSMPEQFPSSLPNLQFCVQSLPIPGDSYDPSSHCLSGVKVSSNDTANLVPLSEFMHSLSSNFSIRNVAQFFRSPSAPPHCSAFSIPVSISHSSLSKSEHAPIPIPSAHESFTAITVPLATSSRDGKDKFFISGNKDKRNLGDIDDVEELSAPKQRRRGPVLPPRITRSKTGTILASSSTVSAPSRSRPKRSGKSYRPSLLSLELLNDWKVHVKRDSILEKSIYVEDLTEKCNIIPLLRDQQMFSSLQTIGPHFAWLTAEFYTNRTMDTFTVGSPHFQQVFIRDKWHPFGPSHINAFLGTPSPQPTPYPSPHLLAAALTHNQEVSWPRSGLPTLKLTMV